MSLAFLLCVENGRLEEEAKLLCRSIRRFGGRHGDAAIHTFQPRRGRAITGSTRRALEELGVVHHDEVLNDELPALGTLNKVFVCARAEEILHEDVLVFLDSDTVVINEPEALDLPEGIDAAARPAESVALNSTGPDDPRDRYWRELDRIFGLTDVPFVETELGNRVRAFFSAGLIAVRRGAGLFRSWIADFRRLIHRPHVPEGCLHRMDEVALAATLIRSFGRVRVLDGRYNYLIYRRSRMPAPWRAAGLENLIHLHYRQCFHAPGYLRALDPPFDPTGATFQWLERQLPLEPLFSGRLPH